MNNDLNTPPPNPAAAVPVSGGVIYAVPIEQGQRSGGSGIDLIAAARRLWRDRWMLIGAIGTAALLSVTVSLLQPNVYTATLVALPPASSGSGSKLGQYADLAAMAGMALPSTSNGSVDEITAILDSRTLAEQLIKEFDLQAYYKTAVFDDALTAMRTGFSARHDKKTNRILLTYTHRDPKIAAAVVDRAGAVMQNLFNAIHRSSSKRERTFIESRLNLAEQNWATAQAKLAEFQIEHHAYQLESQTRATVEAISTLQGQLIAQQVELRALLTSQASPDNPQIVLLRNRVEELSRALGRLISGMEVEPGEIGANGQTSETGEKSSGVFLGLSALPELGVRYVTLLREAKKHEALFASFTVQAESTRIAEVRDSEVVTIIDPARIPQRKSGPRRSFICIVGTLLGAFFGAVFVLLREPVVTWVRAIRAGDEVAG